MSAAASGPCASWRVQAVARHPPPREAAGWSSAAAGLRRGAMSWCVVRAASWLEGGATPGCPAVSDECVETAAIPAAHQYVSFALPFVCQVCSKGRVRCPSGRLLLTPALRRACSVPGGGWGSVGRVVVADGCSRAPRLPIVGTLHVRWRCCPCCHAWTSRFNGLQAPAGFLPGLPTSALCDVFFGLDCFDRWN